MFSQPAGFIVSRLPEDRPIVSSDLENVWHDYIASKFKCHPLLAFEIALRRVIKYGNSHAELPGAWNWKMPNSAFKKENFLISLSGALLT